MKTGYATALITGASSGIGAEFARVLAAQGSDLILVARSKDKLEALAEQLRSAHGGQVVVIASDLGKPGAATRLKAEVVKRGFAVDLLVNNAGFGSAGAFAKEDATRNQQMIALNVAAVVDLAQAFLPEMLAVQRGAIINVASSAAFQPTPFMAVYGASKAFVLSFSESLWAEARGKRVKVLALCPGPVDTPFFEATGVPGLRKTVPKPMMMGVEAVVAEALAGLAAGKSVVVPGLPNKFTSFLPRLMPRQLMATATGKLMGR